jgi:hypothetical protein
MQRRSLSWLPRLTNFAVMALLPTIVFGLAPSIAAAQIAFPNAIRVEAPEVVVTVVVLDRSHFRMDAYHTFEELDEEITDLAASDFHVFQDGVEQRIQSVSMEQPRVWDVQDNISHHLEESFTPRGIWSSPDLRPQPSLGSSFSPRGIYLVSYVPPPSPEGVCHQIKVKVKRRHATVYARQEYCSTKHPLSDPLNGTTLGKQMENFALSSATDSKTGAFPVSVQAASLFGNSTENRVDVASEFPASAIKREWHGVNLRASVAILGLVFDKQTGLVVARFSDSSSTAPWNFYRGPLPPDRAFLKDWETAGIPSRYETQLDLVPGHYEVQLIVSDGEKFATARVPLNVEVAPSNKPAISALVLSDRFREVPQGAEAAVRPPHYVPLASNGLELTPAANKHFNKRDQVVSYFEIAPPPQQHAATEEIQFHLRITDPSTGELKRDFGWHTAPQPAHTETPGHIIPVAAKIPVDQLPAGTYRLHVQASDTSGQPTDSRFTCFAIE